MLILALPLPKYSAPKSFIQMDIDQVQTKSVPQNSVTWALLSPFSLTLIQQLRQTLDSLAWTPSESFSRLSHLRAFAHVVPSAENYFSSPSSLLPGCHCLAFAVSMDDFSTGKTFSDSPRLMALGSSQLSISCFFVSPCQWTVSSSGGGIESFDVT